MTSFESIAADEIDEYFNELNALVTDQTWNAKNDNEKLKELNEEFVAVEVWRRVRAAMELGKIKDGAARVMLEELTGDSDVVVRYLAVRALNQSKVSEPEFAKKYVYESVLEAIAKAENLFNRIRAGNLKEQFDATILLIQLKRPALPAIWEKLEDKDVSVRRSAQLAYQELNALPNVDPHWVHDIQNRLKQKLSFEFMDEAFIDVVATLAKILGVSIKIDERYENAAQEKITLKVMDFDAEESLRWVAKLAGGEFRLRQKGMEFVLFANACGHENLLIDVRDLEAAGVHTKTWKVAIQKNVEQFPMDEVFSNCRSGGGFLLISTPLDGVGSGRHWAKHVVDYLNGERRKLNLKEVPWNVGSK